MGRPRRASALPAGTRIQPSLTQYSSTSVRSLPLKRMPMPRSRAAGSWNLERGSFERRSGAVSVMASVVVVGRGPAGRARTVAGQGADGAGFTSAGAAEKGVTPKAG